MRVGFSHIVDTDQLAEMSDDQLRSAWWVPQSISSMMGSEAESTAQLVARVEAEIVRRWLADQGMPFRHRLSDVLGDKLAEAKRTGVRMATWPSSDGTTA